MTDTPTPPTAPAVCPACGSAFTERTLTLSATWLNFECGLELLSEDGENWNPARSYRCSNAYAAAVTLRAQNERLVGAIQGVSPKSVLEEACYQGADLPKKWIKERGLWCDGYNQALKDVRAALAAAQPAEGETP